MPIYEYQCMDCGGRDNRVAGLDDHTALCIECGSLMLRLDEDIFQQYFEEVSSPEGDLNQGSWVNVWGPLQASSLIFDFRQLSNLKLVAESSLQGHVPPCYRVERVQ